MTGSGRVNAYTYSYDENGIRTRKTIGNTVTDYYYNGSLLIGIVQTTTNSDGSTETSIQRFSYDANGQVIGVNYNSTYYYYLRNAQGDVVKLIDKTGSTVVEYTYDSWGKLLSTTGSLAETFGAEQPFRYRGYVYDEETGWYYLQSRYYNPEVGRFISADVYLSTGQGVLGHNAYAYCGNNPICRSDPSGYAWWNDAWDWLCGALQDVGEFINSTFGCETQVEITHKEIELHTLFGWIEHGEDVSTSSGVNSDKPIVFYTKTASKWWKLWEYSVGIKSNIQNGGAAIEFGAEHYSATISAGYSSLAVSYDIGRVSITISQDVDWKNNTAGSYTQCYIRPWSVALAAAAIYFGGPAIAAGLAGMYGQLITQFA